MISFNIALGEKFKFSRFIEKLNEVVGIFKPNTLDYEYTTNIEKAIYKEKRFNSYNLFVDFFNQHNYRFDSLRLNKNDEISISLIKSGKELFVYGRVKAESIIYQILDMLNNVIAYAYFHNQLDLTLSKSNKYRSWERKLGKVPSYVAYYKNPRFAGGERDKYLIDLETVPTHIHQMKTDEKLWFGSCCQMYFSEIYYKYIPKPLWDNFNDCTQNLILSNGLRKIVLYENENDYELPVNRKRQWSFRRSLGIDSIAHELCSGKRIEPQNLPVEITKKNCEIGNTKVSRFLDKNNRLVPSNKAVKREIKEYLDDGQSIVFEKSEKITP